MNCCMQCKTNKDIKRERLRSKPVSDWLMKFVHIFCFVVFWSNQRSDHSFRSKRSNGNHCIYCLSSTTFRSSKSAPLCYSVSAAFQVKIHSHRAESPRQWYWFFGVSFSDPDPATACFSLLFINRSSSAPSFFAKSHNFTINGGCFYALSKERGQAHADITSVFHVVGSNLLSGAGGLLWVWLQI